tara:strand:+ start:351 stop:551 length:201 start_codon:yes stop_codon:yes gene_type:complete
MVVAVVVTKVVQELMAVLVVEQLVVEVLDQVTHLLQILLKEIMVVVLKDLHQRMFMELEVAAELVL